MKIRSLTHKLVRLGLVPGLLLASSFLSPSNGQGRDEYFNVESIQCSPITTATINGHTYILACNTPDNSLEVWDTDENKPAAQRFLRRIPVGLEPVSVYWDGDRSRFTVASFLSDSLTTGVLLAATGPQSLYAKVDKMQNVGDEPIDLTLTPDGSTLLVTFKGASSVGAFNPVTLDPVPISLSFPDPTDNLLLEATTPTNTQVIGEPHAVTAWGDQFFVLGSKGGIAGLPAPGDNYDFDLYARSLIDDTVTHLGGLGSTNWNMTFSSGGDLFVVGGMAQVQLSGSAVAAAPTGFVTTNLYKVSGAGTASPTILDRDLNMNASGGSVSKSRALTMATDVAVFEPATGAMKVFVAAYGSDRVGVLGNTSAPDPLNWTLRRIAVPSSAGSLSSRSGPRGLSIKLATPAALDPGDRLYVLNRLDNSIAIIDPVTNTHVETIKLNADPTPDHIVLGREFLYSADLSGSGFVSCASCHVDGRTDSLLWNLGEPGGFSTDFVSDFIDSPSGLSMGNLLTLLANGYESDKGPLVTQTFQGLLNFDVEPLSQESVTNAPYHWRGDREDFLVFNEGFANLMGLGDLTPEEPTPKGIPVADMELFEDFVNSINYPPNPKQPETRVYSGALGSADDTLSGSGAQQGMKAFHIRKLVNSDSLNSRSCVHCHSLPFGSNTKTTDSYPFSGNRHPLESAQLRGLFQREMFFEIDGFDTGGTAKRRNNYGLTHAGGRGSINRFVALFPLDGHEVDPISQYMHEFDFGAGPMIGQVLTVKKNAIAAGSIRLAEFEAQVNLANNGLAIIGDAGGATLDYWYDPVTDLYVEESTGGTKDRASLLALLASTRDRLHAICTPLGNTRRVASTSGTAGALTGAAPANLVLEPMATNTANVLVPNLTGNWIPQAHGGDFRWDPGTNALPTPRYARAIRQFQYGLIFDAPNDYGISALRHDAPRRFRVSGDNILEGAKLHLYSPADTSGAPPNTSLPPGPMKTVKLTFDLYPTSRNTGAPVWETAAELAPIVYYALMNGGSEAPGVSAALDDTFSALPEPPATATFDPDGFNYHYIEVENPDGTVGAGDWFRLKMAP